MKYIKFFSGLLFVILIFILAFNFFQNKSDYYVVEPLATHSKGGEYVGSKECITCHADIYQSHVLSAHYNSSSIATSKTILGSFENTSNNLFLKNDSISIKMESQNNRYFQNTYFKHNDSLISSLSFDVVIGSGTRGQSYLHWIKDSLFQIQASYSSQINDWINSPGYSDTTIRKLRFVSPRCLECHTTYAGVHFRNITNYSYNKEKIIYGIDCERCHGPAGDHVSFHMTFPDSIDAKHILKYNDLSRKQKLDACALCHSGLRLDAIKRPFSFLAGDNLNNHSFPETLDPYEELDVHGNQYGLLTASKCFKKSATMDCSTCHDPHKNERGDLTSFVNKCMQCHSDNDKIPDCKMTISERTNSEGSNCVSCHMPLVASKGMQIQSTTSDSLNPVFLRTHHITIPEDIKKVSKERNKLENYIHNL